MEQHQSGGHSIQRLDKMQMKWCSLRVAEGVYNAAWGIIIDRQGCLVGFLKGSLQQVSTISYQWCICCIKVCVL